MPHSHPIQSTQPINEPVPFSKAQTLCIDCRFATAVACRWIRDGDLTGLEYVSHDSPRGTPRMGKFKVVKVIYCPRFMPGELPGLGDVI